MDLHGATDDSTRKILLFHRPSVAIRRILSILFILSKTALDRMNRMDRMRSEILGLPDAAVKARRALAAAGGKMEGLSPAGP